MASTVHGQTELAFNQLHRTFEYSNPVISKEFQLKKTVSSEICVRPFITDDARVVGERLAQLETWVRIDNEAGQHWIMGAYGPNKRMELTIGGVYGYQNDHSSEKTFSYALPLMQVKYLFKEYKPNKAPGVGIVIGTFLPVGKGLFKPAGYGTFSYLTVSQSIGKGDKFLLHGNLGGNYLHIDGANSLIATWGFGSQIIVYKGLNVVGEVFSGDPYVPGRGTAYQVGYRYFFSDLVQMDMTVGEGFGGQNKMPFWFSAGIRIVTERFLKKKDGK